jgi:hypothetical protein
MKYVMNKIASETFIEKISGFKCCAWALYLFMHLQGPHKTRCQSVLYGEAASWVEPAGSWYLPHLGIEKWMDTLLLAGSTQQCDNSAWSASRLMFI